MLWGNELNGNKSQCWKNYGDKHNKKKSCENSYRIFWAT